MSLRPETIVLFALLAIIPSLVVAVVLFLRQEAQKGDIKELERKLLHFIGDVQSKTALLGELNKQVVVAEAESQGLRLRMTNFEESFTALSNKWNSRERAERLAEKRSRRKDEDEEDEVAAPQVLPEFKDIPGTEQQMIPFPQQQQQPTASPAKKRAFGRMP